MGLKSEGVNLQNTTENKNLRACLFGIRGKNAISPELPGYLRVSAFIRTGMTVIAGNVLNRPFDALFKGPLTHITICFNTNRAGRVRAGIRVNEELYGFAKLFSYQA